MFQSVLNHKEEEKVKKIKVNSPCVRGASTYYYYEYNTAGTKKEEEVSKKKKEEEGR